MKKIKELIRCRELIFTATVYPVLLIIILHVKSVLVAWVSKSPVYYSLITLFCAILICVFVALEIVTKVYNYEMQGDKLKIRQQEGIDIEELNNGR